MEVLASLFGEMVSVEDVNETPTRVASDGFVSAAGESYRVSLQHSAATVKANKVALAFAMPGACAMLDRPTVAGE